MGIRYTVLSVNQDEAEVDALVAGQTVKAKVPVLTVEMVSEDGSMGHTFRFTQFGEDEMSLFVVGATVDASFAAA